MCACALLGGVVRCQTGKDVGVFVKGGGNSDKNMFAKAALVIGVQDYDKLPRLTFPDKDARDIGRMLEQIGFSVTLMVSGSNNAARSKPRLTRTLDAFCESLHPDSIAIIYYSGHGFEDPTSRKAYVCPADTDPLHLPDDALELTVIEERVKKAARITCLVMDMCRNNPSKSVTANKGGAFTEDAMARTVRGVAHLFSAAPGFCSFEPNGDETDIDGNMVKNGFFTHYFLRGLEGAAEPHPGTEPDGCISFREVAYYVKRCLALQSKKSGMMDQEPWLNWDGTIDDDFPLRWLEVAPKTPVESSEGLPVRIALRMRGGEPVSTLIHVQGAEDYAFGGEQRDIAKVAAFDMRMSPGDLAPAHQRVTSYYLDETEVTVAQFRSFLKSGFERADVWRDSGQRGDRGRLQVLSRLLAEVSDDLPVAGVSWCEAAAYARWVHKRLPELVEWEYAVRGGADYRVFSCQDEAGQAAAGGINVDIKGDMAGGTGVAWSVYVGCDVTTGSRGAGIRNLCSNVSEWTGTSGRREGLYFVAGGSFATQAYHFRTVTQLPRTSTRSSVGFRCAMDEVNLRSVMGGRDDVLQLAGRQASRGDDR